MATVLDILALDRTPPDAPLPQKLSDLAHARCWPFVAENGVAKLHTHDRFFGELYTMGEGKDTHPFGIVIDFAAIYADAVKGVPDAVQQLDLYNAAMAVRHEWPWEWAEAVAVGWGDTDWARYLFVRDATLLDIAAHLAEQE